MPTDPATPALAAALDRVGDRWAFLVVHALLGGARRFGELQHDVAGIAPNILSARLKHLERVGLVVARPYSRRPPRSTYELTAAGAELAGTLVLLASWGAAQGGDEAAEALVHAACGTHVDARWWCPTCARDVDLAADELRYL